MNDFLSFKKMITPIIIQALFWAGAGLSVIVGLVAIGSGISSSFNGGSQVFIGLMILILGPVITRIYCELLILFFRINETLTEIHGSLRQGTVSQGTAAGSNR
jgi:hypothetical protein